MAARKKTTGVRARAGRPAAGAGPARGRRAARGDDRAKPAAAAPAAGRAPSSFPEVEELVELMNRHELLEVDWHLAPDGSRRIRLSRAGLAGPGAGSPAPPAAPRPAAHSAAPQAQPAEPAAPPAPAAGEALHAFKSPMVGTFYRAPSPEAPAFVSVGDKVDAHATVCIIEAMKVMNEITPDISGTVVSIEVENGEAVEFGQTLFLLRPN